MATPKNIIRLLRPEQWLKNSLIFMPLFFAQRITDMSELIATSLAFIIFSLLSSAVYCFNDICDMEADKAHPEKCRRPVAAGLVGKKTAYLVMGFAILLATLVFFISSLSFSVLYLCLFYLVLNILYSLYLKKLPILDVFIISIGFVVRLFVGGLSGSVVLSHWIIIITFLLALFLAFSKRKNDCLIYEKSGVLLRKNVSSYNSNFLDMTLAILSAAIIVSYIMYTVSAEVVERIGSNYLYTTAIFVLLGLLRYLQLIVVDGCGSPTKILLKDRPIQLILAGWILLFAAFLYF